MVSVAAARVGATGFARVDGAAAPFCVWRRHIQAATPNPPNITTAATATIIIGSMPSPSESDASTADGAGDVVVVDAAVGGTLGVPAPVDAVGIAVGVGLESEGARDGADSGEGVGPALGIPVGAWVGDGTGAAVGAADGVCVGAPVGVSVGAGLGANVSTDTESAVALDISRRRRSDVPAPSILLLPSSLARRRLANCWIAVVKAPVETASTRSASTCECAEFPVPWPYKRPTTASGNVISFTTVTPASSPALSVHTAAENVALATIEPIAL